MSADYCSLPTLERPTRLAEFDALFASSARRVVRDGESARIHLDGAAGLADRLRDLTERETTCCSFFTFTLRIDRTGTSLTVRAPADAAVSVDALFGAAA